MRGRSSGKTGPPVPGLTRVGGGAKNESVRIDIARFGKPTLSSKAQFHTNRETYNPLDQWCMTRPRAAS